MSAAEPYGVGPGPLLAILSVGRSRRAHNLRGWPSRLGGRQVATCPAQRNGAGPLSSNIGQNYPYSRESEAQRSVAVEGAVSAFDGLGARILAEATPLPAPGLGDTWWVWACPADGAVGRLHVAGYALERHAVYAICDHCGASFLR